MPTHPQAAAQSGHFWHLPSTHLLSQQPALHRHEHTPQAPRVSLIHCPQLQHKHRQASSSYQSQKLSFCDCMGVGVNALTLPFPPSQLFPWLQAL